MAVTVTATQGGSTANGLALRVFVLTSAAATQNGATQNAHITASTAFTASVTTTQAGSRVYGAAAFGANVSASAAANTTLIDNIADATNAERYVTFKTTALTGTPGATTLGVTAASTTDGPLAMAEILAAGTLTEDASAPAAASTLAATAVTTASFTPPAGALLVALAGSDGGAGVTTMAVSDTGGGYTWIELVKNNPTDYAGVWVAQVPAASPPATWAPQRYGQAAPPWQPRQRPYVSDPSSYPAQQAPDSALDTAWQAGGQYSHLYADDALRDRRQYFQQRFLVSDPLLLTGPAAFDPATGAGADTARRYGLPATHADRRLVPQPKDPRNANLAGTAANPLITPLDTAWQAGGRYWHLYNQAGDVTDRREVPQQKDRRDANTTGVPPPAIDPTTNAAEDQKRRASMPATHADRREVPQQRTYPARQPDGSYSAGAGTVQAWWSEDVLTFQVQRTYPAADLATALLENGLLGGAETFKRASMPATHADRREVPQQRTYQDLTPFVSSYTDVGVGSGTTEAWWGTDPAPWQIGQRPYLGVNLATALLENEMLGGAGTVMRYLLPATHADRRLVPAQRTYPGRLPDGSYSAGAGTVQAWWSADDQGWSLQRACVSDPALLTPPVPADPVQLAWLSLRAAATAAATHADRRLVPQQRPYISDPSSYPSGAVTDPLTAAWGAGGPYWHLYNRAADAALRWWMPQQRTYPARQPDGSYSAGAGTVQAWWSADDQGWSLQRPLTSDPALLTAALLENGLLGGAGTAARASAPATHADRRQAGQQRAYPAAPDIPLDVTLAAQADLARRYGLPVTHADRRLVPAQRLYFPPPAPPPPFTVGTLSATATAGGASGGTLTATATRTGGPA